MADEERKSPRKKRRPYGTSRRSAIKKSFSQEQIVFTTPIPGDPTVAIIGGGISGLVCASVLEERGIRSTVFDTGVHGLGGRMATRVVDPQPLVFDHAAQFFTVSDPRFQKFVDRWLEEGQVREWKGLLGELEAGGHFTPIPYSSARYIGTNGMRPLADSVLRQNHRVNIVRPCWISKLEPINGKWHLSENGKPQGQFDAIIIAHNGKCANRLLSSSGLPLLTKQMKSLELTAIWALLAAFKEPFPVPQTAFEGAFVKGVEIALGLSKGALQPFYSRVQLWGAALPTNTPGIPCIFDPQGRAGICGDWLLGASVEAAVISGMSLANHMADYFRSGGEQPDEFTMGLQETFTPVNGHDIGQFDGLESQIEVLSPQAYATCL